ncbi:MAG TPA: hypothetical protein VJ023_11595 [Pyrinomonadaceae bacterium]|nr:hypothetical protein [Pyrinomonadaceae bacterium]
MKPKCLALLAILFISFNGVAQEEARVVWHVTKYDINSSLQMLERTLNVTATLNATNVGRGSGNTLTFRLNSKAVIKSVTVAGANANFRVVPENQGVAQRVTTTLPSAVASNGAVSLTATYTLPIEANTGLAALSPTGSHFLPLSFWYPLPNTPFSIRGVDTSPFRLTVNAPNIVSSGFDKSSGAVSTFEQTLNAQPFFLQGEWDRIEGAAEAKGITVLVRKGITADEKKQAENMALLAGALRSFYATLLGPAPEVPIRLVAVNRGAGFYDSGTVLVESSALRRAKVDSSTALLLAEALAQLWVGAQTPVRGEGGGVLREGLTRFLATAFLEKQYGRNAAQAELLRQRLAYSGVSKRDAPLARSTQMDETYFGSAPNKGAMVWRIVEQQLGRDQFISILRETFQASRTSGVTLAAVRGALAEKGGSALKTVLDHQLDVVTDTDLMIGLPQQRGSEWVSALRNIGSSDVTVKLVATTDRGEQIPTQATIPARGFGEAVFRTSSKIIRAEIDPEKLYPQVDYSNDVVPRVRSLPEGLAEATRLLSTQENVKAEVVARELVATAPQLQESRILLARALLAQNRADEAERLFRQVLDEVLPTPQAFAWGNIGLGQIALRRGQSVEAARRFTDAARAEADYATSLLARAERIRAEATTNTVPVDEAARAFVSQLDAAIKAGKKAGLEALIIPGELVRFVSGIVGTQPENWQTRVLRSEQVDAATILVDVQIEARELGQDRAGTALLVLSQNGGWKLAGIELFEVR